MLDALAALENDDYESALASYRHADLVYPNHGLTWISIARVYIAQGNVTRAREAAYHLLNCHFSGVSGARYIHSAQTLDQLDDKTEALAVLEAGMLIEEAQRDGGSYVKLATYRARLMKESDEIEEAIDLLRTGLDKLARMRWSDEDENRLLAMLEEYEIAYESTEEQGG